MKRCPATRLPITRKPHWNSPHPAERYTTKFSLIGSDIIYIEIETDCEGIIMNQVDFDVLHSIIDEISKSGAPVYTVANLANISGCSFTYKRDFINFLYNSDPAFRLLVFYNVHPEMLCDMEAFVAIAPEASSIGIVDNYHEALTLIMNNKTGQPAQESPESEGKQQYNIYKRAFVAALARMNWLSIYSLPVTMPASDSLFYPFFRSLQDINNDLREKERLQRNELQTITKEYETKITEKISLLNAHQALYRSMKLQLEHEKSELAAQKASKEMAIARLSATVRKSRAKIEKLCSFVAALDTPSPLKDKVVNLCKDITADEMPCKNSGNEIKADDPVFFSFLHSRHPNLTERELQVSMLIKQDLSSAEIACSTGLSPRGVESLRYRMHKKLGLQKNESLKKYLLGLNSA